MPYSFQLYSKMPYESTTSAIILMAVNEGIFSAVDGKISWNKVHITYLISVFRFDDNSFAGLKTMPVQVTWPEPIGNYRT